MGLPIKNTKLNTIEGIDTFYNGGKGSGNFGHSGRPGKVGGSAPSGSGSSQSGSSDFLAQHESKRAEYSLSADKGYNALKDGKTGFENVEELANGALTLFSRLEESETLDVAAADALNMQMAGLNPKLKKAMLSAGLTGELRGVMEPIENARVKLDYLISEITQHSQSATEYSRESLTPLDEAYENINTYIKKAESRISKANRENKEVDEYYTEARYMLEGLGNAARKMHNLVNELPSRVPHDIIINKPKENK